MKESCASRLAASAVGSSTEAGGLREVPCLDPSRIDLRRLLGIGAVALVTVLVIVAGIRIGQEATRTPAPLQLAAGGPLQAVYLANGSIYLGAIVGDDGTYLRLAGGAVVHSRPAPSGGNPVLAVDVLTATPFNLGSDVLIPRAQVALIANVIVGSDIANAYVEASGVQPVPSASPGASPDS